MFNSLKTRMVLMVGIPILLVNFGLLLISASQQQKAALIQAEDLSRAINREHSIHIQSLLDTAMSAASMTSVVFRNVNDTDNPLDMGRESASLILKGLLVPGSKYEGVFCIWEPDAFDMIDFAYEGLPGCSARGRFSPYWINNDGNDPELDVFSDEEINGKSGWYSKIRHNPGPSVIWNPGGGLPGDSRQVLRTVAPIINDGRFLGVVGIDIEKRIFESMVADWAMICPETIIHLHTLDGTLVVPAFASTTTHCGDEAMGKIIPGVNWAGDKLVSSRVIENFQGQAELIVVEETSRDFLLGPMRQKMRKSFGIGLSIILSTLLFAGYFIKKNLARLVELQTFTRRVASGEKFEPVKVKSRDEIGALFQDFNSMLVSLHEAEGQREESLTRMKTIFESVKAGIVIIDPEERKIVDANPAALKMIGLSREKVLQRVCHGFMCPASTDSCPILDLNQKVDGDRKVLLKSDGSKLMIFKTVVPLVLKGKKFLLETFVDVAEQVNAENALAEKLAQISQAKKQQDILVSHAVSREERMVKLKTEVNDLRIQLDLPSRYRAPEEIKAWRQKMKREETVVHHEI